jgi:hypothetical protein
MRGVDYPPQLMPRLRMGGAIPLHTLYDFGMLQSELYFLLVLMLFGGKNYFLSPVRIGFAVLESSVKAFWNP